MKDLLENTVDHLRLKIDELIITLESKPILVPIEGCGGAYHFTAGLATGESPIP
jgi:hypothetical protein